VSTLNVVSKGGQEILFKKLRNNTNWPSHFTLFYHFGMWFHRPIADVITRVKFYVDWSRGYVWHGYPKSGFPIDFDCRSYNTVTQCVLHCDANCLGLCRPTVFRRNVFFEMTVVAQSSVAPKIIRPNVFRPTGFSPNRLHPRGRDHDTSTSRTDWQTGAQTVGRKTSWAKDVSRLGELFFGRQTIGRQARTVRRQQIGRLGDIVWGFKPPPLWKVVYFLLLSNWTKTMHLFNSFDVA